MAYHFRILSGPEDLQKYKILRVNDQGEILNLDTAQAYDHEMAQGITDFPRTSTSIHLQKDSPSDTTPFVVVDFCEPDIRYVMHKRVTGITDWFFDIPQVAWPSVEYDHDFFHRMLHPVSDWKHKILLTIENLLYSNGWQCLSPKHARHEHYRVNIILTPEPSLRFTTHYVCGCIRFAELFSLAKDRVRDGLVLQETIWDDEMMEFGKGARCTSAQATETGKLVGDMGWNPSKEIWLQASMLVEGGEELSCQLYEIS